MCAINSERISSCSGSSSRMHGVREVFGARTSTDLDNVWATIPLLWQPEGHSLQAAARGSASRPDSPVRVIRSQMRGLRRFWLEHVARFRYGGKIDCSPVSTLSAPFWNGVL